jgi:hypothetical protein
MKGGTKNLTAMSQRWFPFSGNKGPLLNLRFLVTLKPDFLQGNGVLTSSEY